MSFFFKIVAFGPLDFDVLENMDAKKEAIFRKLDKRNEDHQTVKERNKEARQEENESTPALDKLNSWLYTLQSRIENEMEKCERDQDSDVILNEISLEIQKLEAFFTEKSPVLAPYDIRKLQNSVNDVRTQYVKLQDALKPKKKFGFKRDKKKAAVLYKVAVEKEPKSDGKIHSEFEVTFKDKTNEVIEVDNIEGQDVMLCNLKNCRIVMRSNPVTLHMTHLDQCVFLGGPVQTSIYLDHCNHCTMSIMSNQHPC